MFLCFVFGVFGGEGVVIIILSNVKKDKTETYFTIILSILRTAIPCTTYTLL